MIDFKEIPSNSQAWKRFAIDFLQELGFYLEPGTQAFGRNHFVVSEQIKGRNGNYKLRWLVSTHNHIEHISAETQGQCMQKAADLKCDGFIGLYCGQLAQCFIDRLDALRNEVEIKNYLLFDQNELEKRLKDLSFSGLLAKHFPKSAQRMAGLNKLTEEYLPLQCFQCNKDILPDLEVNNKALVSFDLWYNMKDNREEVRAFYWYCSEQCVNEGLHDHNDKLPTKLLSELILPSEYLNWMFNIMDALKARGEVYSKNAYAQLSYLMTALSQKVFRKPTERQQETALHLQEQRRRILGIHGFNESTAVEGYRHEELDAEAPANTSKKANDGSQLSLGLD